MRGSFLVSSLVFEVLTMPRYCQVPMFGCDTIQKFSNNASTMKKLAAWDFEDLLQVCWCCVIIMMTHMLDAVCFAYIWRTFTRAIWNNCYGSLVWAGNMAWTCKNVPAYRINHSVFVTFNNKAWYVTSTISICDMWGIHHMRASLWRSSLWTLESSRGCKVKHCRQDRCWRADGYCKKKTKVNQRKFNLTTYKAHSLENYIEGSDIVRPFCGKGKWLYVYKITLK